MPERAAIVTGASRGIGLAVAEFLAARGYGLTVSARRPEGLETAAAGLRERGAEVEAVPANMADEDALRELVARHEARFGRLDLLVNNAGVGIGAPADAHQARHVDLQLDVNLRAIVLMYRECARLLRAAGAEHRTARVVNLASIAGKEPQPWLSVYSATKAAVIAYTQAMNKELSGDGVLSTAICPGFVDTDMSEFVKQSIPAEEMLTTGDVTAALGFVLSTSPACLVPEVVLRRPGADV
jgi:NAD(P)-dependent dehydrogenase (short-subunit alcohol dehydrogenase family)